MEFEIREDRTRPQGRKKLARERAAYFQRMDQGYSNRVVGIDVRTGKRWRNGDRLRGQGRRPLPPARKAPMVCGPSRYLRHQAMMPRRRRSGAPSAPQVGSDAA
ncbi:hypothetical protein ACFY04_41730 [Streptomyces sp. NPDC001549]|uniref:hypothetical protein n=1 Tax=Streptomyces sp. NPDC001549 TaxID=3364586 RepID=UPI003684F5DD